MTKILEIWITPGFRDGGTKLDCSPRLAFTKVGKSQGVNSKGGTLRSRGIWNHMTPNRNRQASTPSWFQRRSVKPLFDCAKSRPLSFSLHPDGCSLFLEYSRVDIFLCFDAFPFSPVSICILSICFPSLECPKEKRAIWQRKERAAQALP